MTSQNRIFKFKHLLIKVKNQLQVTAKSVKQKLLKMVDIQKKSNFIFLINWILKTGVAKKRSIYNKSADYLVIKYNSHVVMLHLFLSFSFSKMSSVLLCILTILRNFCIMFFALSQSWFFTFISKCKYAILTSKESKILHVFFYLFSWNISQYNFTQGFILSKIFSILYTLICTLHNLKF